MSDAEIRYCTTEDGVRIAYTVQGEGPALIMCPFFIESFSLAEALPEYMEFVDGFARGRRLVRFDMRGTGLSQRDVNDFSLQTLSLDIEAVVGGLGLRRFILYGGGMSGPRVIAYAVNHPDKVSHLILYSTFVRPADVMDPGVVRGFAELARSAWHMAAQTLTDLSGRERVSDLNVRSAGVIRASAEGEAVARLIEQSAETSDVTDLLPLVKAPTLVVQNRRTQLFKPEFGMQLASSIPNANLRLFEGAYNWLDPGAGTMAARWLDEFLGVPTADHDAYAAAPPQEARAATFRAIVFTDLVGHTEMMQRLGDAAGRDVLREHERVTRETIARYGGTEVKTDGDSFMISFTSVTAATECAIALQRAFAAREGEPLSVRIGIDAGEPIEEEGDLFGATVIMAARVKDQAGAGDIMVPETVRGLLAGKGFSFAERGEFQPKGFDDAVRLFEVRWRD